MNKVIINGLSFEPGREYYGVQRFEFELLNQLDLMDLPYNLEVVVPNGPSVFDTLSSIHVTKKKVPQNRKLASLFNIFWFPMYVLRNKALSVDLALSFSLPASNIVAIHDCIMERDAIAQGKKSIPINKRFYFRRIKQNARKCNKIITVSAFSKQDIIDFYHVDHSKICIIPNAWQHFDRIVEDSSIIEKYHLPLKGYFYSLGSRSKRKNDKWIISAAKQNPKDFFVVSGSTSFEGNGDENDMPNNVLFTGYLSDGEIKALMKNCKAFIQPSIIEGFGIPPMEAMSVGAQCIVSNASALPEIYKDSVWYVDPLNYDHIIMDEIMKGETTPIGDVLQRYSWRHSAEILDNVIRETLDENA